MLPFFDPTTRTSATSSSANKRNTGWPATGRPWPSRARCWRITAATCCPTGSCRRPAGRSRLFAVIRTQAGRFFCYYIVTYPETEDIAGRQEYAHVCADFAAVRAFLGAMAYPGKGKFVPARWPRPSRRWRFWPGGGKVKRPPRPPPRPRPGPETRLGNRPESRPPTRPTRRLCPRRPKRPKRRPRRPTSARPAKPRSATRKTFRPPWPGSWLGLARTSPGRPGLSPSQPRPMTGPPSRRAARQSAGSRPVTWRRPRPEKTARRRPDGRRDGRLAGRRRCRDPSVRWRQRRRTAGFSGGHVGRRAVCGRQEVEKSLKTRLIEKVPCRSGQAAEV